MQETITGTVKAIAFSNEAGWKKFILYGKNGKEIPVTGVAPDISEGAYLEVNGEYQNHPKYGRSFKASSIIPKIPTDCRLFQEYLETQIEGIGAKTAKLLIDMFHEDTLEVLANHPERIRLPRISRTQIESFSMQLREKGASREEQMLFLKLGISQKFQDRIKKEYGKNACSVVKENPYQMIGKIKGMNFSIADCIAEKGGIPKDSINRVKSGICCLMESYAGAGHAYIPYEMCCAKAVKTLKVKTSIVNDAVREAERDGTIILDGGNVYLDKYFTMEKDVACQLVRLAKYSGHKDINNKDVILQRIKSLEKEKGICLDQIQRMAVFDAVTNGVMVITGGPGTGKTTVLDTIIRYLKNYEASGDSSILLMAPTGRAAKRMNEQTGLDAGTIHRTVLSVADRESIKDLFEENDEDEDGDGSYKSETEFSENNKKQGGYLDAETVIVDEFSMVSLPLAKSLFKVLKDGVRLLIVGDVNQLPSIGVGQVLRDIINSGIIKVCMLKNVYRQAAESNIISGAYSIINGQYPDLKTVHDDFALVKNTNRSTLIRFMQQLISDVLPRKFGMRPIDIQILCPRNGDILGVDECNSIMQEYMNPSDGMKAEITIGKNLFREGDKVINLRNNYEIAWEIVEPDEDEESCGCGVFNGEVGIIQSIDDGEVNILFDEEKLAVFSIEDMKYVQLAYAVTVHKSQGSEYPAVLMPLVKGGNGPLYNRNLLYTAVTRAKDSIIMLGDPNIIGDMIKNQTAEKRFSKLSERIRMASAS